MTDPKPQDPTADNPGGADAEGTRARSRKPHAVKPRHAASLLVWREAAEGPELLMGMRHPKHKFMPSVLVFPGGRVDRADHGVKVLAELKPATLATLAHRAPPSLARALGVAAIRELFEETGLVIGQRKGSKLLPDLGGLEYLCRAVTPTTRPMRFNARFLTAPAAALTGEIKGSGELEGLGWYSLGKARAAKLANITVRIIDEFEAWHATPAEARAARPKIVYKGNDNRLSDE